FSRTLLAGSLQIERIIDEAQSNGQRVISGERAFDLYQTYGFPVELTEEMLREHDLELDRAGYERALAHERERARSSGRFTQEQRTADSEFAGLQRTEFLAWTATQGDARVLALGADDGVAAHELAAGSRARLV